MTDLEKQVEIWITWKRNEMFLRRELEHRQMVHIAWLDRKPSPIGEVEETKKVEAILFSREECDAGTQYYTLIKGTFRDATNVMYVGAL